MNLALGLLKVYRPAAVKRKLLRELYVATARAFAAEPPELRGLTYDSLLESYGAFTKTQAEKLLLENDERIAAVRERLFENAYALGLRLRQALGLRSLHQVLAASRVLYQALRIDFAGSPDGGVTISACYFSCLYTPGVCRVMSSIDAGVAAGLSGGGRLEFSERITEGSDRCRARLTVEEKRP